MSINANDQAHNAGSRGSSRRHFLATQAMGIGGLALAWLLNQEEAHAVGEKPDFERPTFDLKPKTPLHEPQATAMISFFMQGGPSHVDLFENKSELTKRDGEKIPGEIKYDSPAQADGTLMKSPWKFAPQGECGIELSELLPGLGEVVDDITLVRSMQSGVNNHVQGIRAMNSGGILPGRPSLGSWLTYGLGTESQDLPAYMVLRDPASLPVDGISNWTNGWLPALYQGTVVRPTEPRILNLQAPPELQGEPQKNFLAYLDQLNREHLETRPGEHDLSARIASYELAARMQSAARDVLDISDETEATLKLYGIDEPTTRDFGTRALIARRLVERGVRFVQILSANQAWDHHSSIATSLPAACKKVDVPAAGLLKDLKQRGLLDTTLVQWGGEMGRLPTVQKAVRAVGRDHNTHGFSIWLAGGGVRGGYAHGATDEFGHKAVENVVPHTDYHATLLHLFGLEAERLTFRRPTGDRSLLDGQAGRIVKEILKRPEGVRS
ncbi:DUF1501 domain-containing protein [Lignipirellula cremea]|uniref:DUF1501 domain-containing protein n=1 Tax=Lignipirellula cremea TaxID=2528010 RepID=A0A518E2V5_9BACT|nr:DUF1501 domain-containing protein [Lignipirellula cremea]QDU98393.1 hypothetical protein Pla8534_62610 [Lignipirellula cremea]